jgi:hypothetical protein
MKYAENDHHYALKKANKIKGIRLLGGKCFVCKESDIHLMEFHHDNKNKENSISQILDRRWSNLKLEINKCKLLCSNCHAEYHCNSVGKRAKNKIKVLKILGISKCSKCGYEGKNFASLDFHHQDPKIKSFNISKRIKEITLKEIMDESKKCLVVCKNCHKKDHNDIERFNKLKSLIEYKIANPNEKPPEYNKDQIWELYSDGKSLMDICKIMKCKHGTMAFIIQQLRKKNSLEYRDHRVERNRKLKNERFF